MTKRATWEFQDRAGHRGCGGDGVDGDEQFAHGRHRESRVCRTDRTAHGAAAHAARRRVQEPPVALRPRISRMAMNHASEEGEVRGVRILYVTDQASSGGDILLRLCLTPALRQRVDAPPGPASPSPLRDPRLARLVEAAPPAGHGRALDRGPAVFAEAELPKRRGPARGQATPPSDPVSYRCY